MTTDNLIERVGMALARHHFPPWSLEAAAKAAIAAVQEWQPIGTIPTNGKVFVTSHDPGDPWPCEIEVVVLPVMADGRLFNQNSHNLTHIKHWNYWHPMLPEPPSKE